MKKIRVFYPLLLAVHPVVYLYVHNIQETAFSDAVRPALVLLASALLLGRLLSCVVRDEQKSGLILTALLLSFFSFSHYQTGIAWLRLQGFELIRGRYLFVLWFLLLPAVIACVIRTRRRLDCLTTYLNIVATVLVAMPLVTGAMLLSQHKVTVSIPRVTVTNAATRISPAAKPDIYYIILDAYGRSDLLREVYRYDNTPFLDELAKRGFYLAQASRANYCQTQLSLASSLNYTYLDALARTPSNNANNRIPLRALIDENHAARFLKQHGYRFVSISSGYFGTFTPHADLFLKDNARITEFDNQLIALTPLSLFRFLNTMQYQLHRNQLAHAVGRLAEAPGIASPKFVLTHIIAPHPPFVFAADGAPVNPDRPYTMSDGSHFRQNGGTTEEYLRQYPQQVAHFNKQILAAIDRILNESRTPPLIILQGDHGPGSGLDWESATRSNLRERLCILNAYYVPARVKQDLYAGISPVNTFRVIFNRCYGTRFPLLPDRSYYSTWTHPYQFLDVTGQVTGNQEEKPARAGNKGA